MTDYGIRAEPIQLALRPLTRREKIKRWWRRMVWRFRTLIGARWR